jgi:hypothetical protein
MTDHTKPCMRCGIQYSQQQLKNASVLIPPNPNQPFKTEIDDLDFGVGTGLFQTRPDDR